MNVYFVRIIKTREFVGIFWGQTLAQACLRVDEHVKPDACEYKPFGDAGGIFWNINRDLTVPRSAEAWEAMYEEDEPLWPEEQSISFSDTIDGPLLRDEDGWVAFDAATIQAANEIMADSLRDIGLMPPLKAPKVKQ